jgi:hypothetical protein
MKRSVLLIVTGDPRRSARPAEAVRIAAGLSANGRLDVTLCLRGASVLALGEEADDLMDGDYFTRYLPVVAEGGRIVTAPAGSDEPLISEPPVVPDRTLTQEDLQHLVASSDRVLRF